MDLGIQIHRLALAACFALLHATAGWAQTTRFAAGYGSARYAAEEPSPTGGVSNREDGRLERRTLEARHRNDGWTWQAAHRRSEGTLDYRGSTQIGLPLRTLTDLQRSESALGGAFASALGGPGADIALGAGVEEVRTRRRIRATGFSGELIETLHTRQWLLGASASYAMQLGARPLRMSIALQADRPWSQRLVVDSLGVLDTFGLRPAPRWGSRLGFAAEWTVGAGLEIGIHIEQQIYRPGAAMGGTASYPGSVQKLRSLVAALSWTP